MCRCFNIYIMKCTEYRQARTILLPRNEYGQLTANQH